MPQDLHDGGSYTIHASVASFALNVLCVNVEEEELAPIVYGTWPNAVPMENSSMGTNYWPIQAFPDGTNTNNQTVLDDIFGWKDETEDHSHARPSKTGFPHVIRICAHKRFSISQVSQGRKHGKRATKILDILN
jgi:hypothetical protein